MKLEILSKLEFEARKQSSKIYSFNYYIILLLEYQSKTDYVEEF